MIDTMTDRLDKFVDRIQKQFPNVHIEFSLRSESEDYGELWVYVLDLDRYDEVRKFCEDLEAEIDRSDLPIWILTKSWTGPWPGGESEAELRERRIKFKERMQQEFGTR